MAIGALALAATFSFSLVGCDDEPEVEQSVNKTGSVEVMLSTKHLNDSLDLVITTYKVWSKLNVVKTREIVDTVPSLGVTTTEGENDEGETATVTVPKEYEFYVTVK